MKVLSIKSTKYQGKPTKVMDCSVESGFVKTSHASLPDIDVDFSSDKRPLVKAYLENRYDKPGQRRVFSAGTFTTQKIKSAVKDVARTKKVSVGSTNYFNAILEDNMTFTDVMVQAFENKRVKDYVEKNPDVFEDILPIFNQPRSAGIHASAVVVTPEYINGEKLDCFSVLPIRKMNDLIVSELGGVDIDAIGLLKNDVLAIAELERFQSMLEAIRDNYGVNLTLEDILNQDLNEPEIYKMIQKGITQGLFQMSGDGMTRYMRKMKPDNINDLIASIALFRPGALDSGAAEGYCDAKNGMFVPEYLWGTYDALKDTFGFFVYQEQVAQVARSVGNLSLADGVNLVKALSKKKVEKVRKFKDKYFEGAKKNGCPKEAAEKIWENIEAGAKYLFNLSHATAYGLTGFISAWIKVHYPVAFFTVILQWVDEKKLPTVMNEMRDLGTAKIVQPDINISGVNFVTDYKTSTIYWSLSRIKYLGLKAVQAILRERDMFGKFDGLEDFIQRIFRKEGETNRSVTSRSVKQLIFAGAFDTIEGIRSQTERFGLLQKASELLGFEISDDELPIDRRGKHYYWSKKQIEVSGMGSVDYKRIYDGLEGKLGYVPYKSLDELMKVDMNMGNWKPMQKFAFCATISEVTEKRYDAHDGTKKRFGKVMLLQNTDVMQLTIWNDAWEEMKDNFMAGRIIAGNARVKYSDYDGCNTLQMDKNFYVRVI